MSSTLKNPITDVRGRITTLLIALSASLGLSIPAEGQFLDLDPVPPRPDTGDSSVVTFRAGEIRSEINSIQERGSEDHVISSLTNAIRTYRRLTFKLLVAARAHPESDHVANAGMILASQRNEFDRLIIGLGATPPRNAAGNALELVDLARLLAQLDSFSADATALIDSVDVTNTTNLDAALSLALEPLLGVIAELEQVMLKDPWPSGAGASGTPIERCLLAIDRLQDHELRAHARAMLDEIESRVEFADLKAAADRDGEHLIKALALVDALAEARWLPDDRVIGILERLDQILERWSLSDERDATRAQLEYMGALVELVEATNLLDAVDPGSRSMRRSIDAVVTDPVEALRIDSLRARSRRLKRAVNAVLTATMVREFKTESPARELIQARRTLDQDYERAEREVFNRLEELVGSGTALIDPDLGGLVSRQMDLADDLKLLRDASSWTDLVTRKAPKNSRRFKEVLKLLARQLSETTKRGAASIALDVMERQFESALDPPFIDRLIDTEPSAINLTGGRDQDLLLLFEGSQFDLIQDWCDGAPDGQGAVRFDLMIRLLDQLESISRLVEIGGSDSLNHWGGWKIEQRSGVVDLSVLQARLKITVEFMIRGDEQAAKDQLDRLDTEMPMARLAVQIGAILGPRISQLPDGVASNIARLAYPPADDDALVAYRQDLETLGRYTWELQHALHQKDQAAAERINEFCSSLAIMLTNELNGRPDELPDLKPVTTNGPTNEKKMN
jgi:hypothetical protein